MSTRSTGAGEVSRPSGEASARGKVILLGEHAVVYGQPALAAPIDLGLRARVTLGAARTTLRSRGHALEAGPAIDGLERVARSLGAGPVDVEVDGDLPVGGGLGSSAALGVVVARAIARAQRVTLSPLEQWRAAMELERAVHGTPSGVDAAAVAWNLPIRFVRGDGATPQVQPLCGPRSLELVLALSGKARESARLIAGLRERRQQDPAAVEHELARLGRLALSGERAIAGGNLSALGALFDEAHASLAALGVSTPELEAVRGAALRAGALGAKLTGAGGGGAIVALCVDAADVARELRAQGFTCYTRVLELPLP